MFKNFSISTKLTLMNIAVSAAALILAALVFLAYDKATARANLVESLSTQSQIIAANSVSALMFNDPASAQNTLSALQSSPDIEGAGLFTPDGRLFAEYWRSPEDRMTIFPRITPDQTEIHLFTTNHLVLMRNINFQGKYQGTIYIRSNLEPIHARQNNFIRLMVIVLAFSLVAALLVSAAFRRAVAKPIVDLADTARKISRERDYSMRASTSGEHNELGTLITAFNEMLNEIQQREGALRTAHDELERRVEERTQQLVAANRDLEAFSYSVSHDLRGPLEAINNITFLVLNGQDGALSKEGKDQVQHIQNAAMRMAQLIEDLLNLAHVGKVEMHRENVDLSAMARTIVEELKRRTPERNVHFEIVEGAIVRGDSRLLRIAMDNLLGNAWKYTSKTENAAIEFGKTQRDGRAVYYIRDNGAGFDPRNAPRLFQPFQRLHPASQFPGTGVGLATVLRIMQKHDGRIWAEAEVGRGATFFFAVGQSEIARAS